MPPPVPPLVIVVRLVSATRRPTEHRAHHDCDGRPATAGPRRQARDEERRIGRTECVNVGHFRTRRTPYVLDWAG